MVVYGEVGRESGFKRVAVSLNGKDSLSFQLSLITLPTILFSILSPSQEEGGEGEAGLFPPLHCSIVTGFSSVVAHVALTQGGGPGWLVARPLLLLRHVNFHVNNLFCHVFHKMIGDS